MRCISLLSFCTNRTDPSGSVISVACHRSGGKGRFRALRYCGECQPASTLLERDKVLGHLDSKHFQQNVAESLLSEHKVLRFSERRFGRRALQLLGCRRPASVFHVLYPGNTTAEIVCIE